MFLKTCRLYFIFYAGMNSSVSAVSAGGNMIMTNSNMGAIGNMAGGGLVVSSSVNKQTLTNTTTMMTSAQPHLGAGHVVPQVTYFL